MAVAVHEDSRRQILGVELKERNLAGLEYVVSDDHAGLKPAIRDVVPEAAWQRRYGYFPRDALD